MMAGHTLLKVFVGFAWTLINFSGLTFLLHIVPLLILFPLFGLELGVALIQSYVFSLLTCIFKRLLELLDGWTSPGWHHIHSSPETELIKTEFTPKFN